jgi:Endonuclease/Exonuclease/phosphatase family
MNSKLQLLSTQTPTVAKTSHIQLCRRAHPHQQQDIRPSHRNTLNNCQYLIGPAILKTLTLTMTNNSTPAQTQLRIWQQNVGKSMISTQHLLNSDIHDHYDILAIQEPYLDQLGNTRASHKWRALYPTTKADGRHPYRTAILINNSISTSLCRPLPFPSPDVTVIHLAFPNNPITIFNIYNDGEHEQTIDKLLTYRTENPEILYPVPHAHILWLGDFNCHHPTWDHERNHRYFTVAAIQAAK